MLDLAELGGPAIVKLAADPQLALPCDEAVVRGDALVALLDGEWRSWPADELFSVRWLERGAGGWRANLTRAAPGGGVTRIDVAHRMFRRRPASVASAALGRRADWPGVPARNTIDADDGQGRERRQSLRYVSSGAKRRLACSVSEPSASK